ncbi:universal stress protein [Ornithinimicrobium sp. W1679]|uniref:universal stress protein n=1 Tax=unclassified Ornithinimicrobium TaxID=2615080 RepID=UPI003CEC3301
MSEQGRPVVVGADGGGTDSAAVRWAARLAERLHRELVVVHASEPEALAARAAGAGAPDVTALLEAEEERADLIRQQTEELGAATGVEVRLDVHRSSPVRALLEHEATACAIVVGTGRKGVLEEFVLGTTSIGVAAHATCPVVVINPEVDVDSLDRGVVGVAVDGSEDSRAAARVALDYAGATGASVLALTTWYLEVVDGYVVTEPDSPEWRQLEAERAAVLESALAGPMRTHPDVPVELSVRRGPVLSTLLEASADVDLMVMGSRGMGSFRGRLLGSVSQRMMRAAGVPVMVVTRPRDRH